MIASGLVLILNDQTIQLICITNLSVNILFSVTIRKQAYFCVGNKFYVLLTDDINRSGWKSEKWIGRHFYCKLRWNLKCWFRCYLSVNDGLNVIFSSLLFPPNKMCITSKYASGSTCPKYPQFFLGKCPKYFNFVPKTVFIIELIEGSCGKC